MIVLMLKHEINSRDEEQKTDIISNQNYINQVRDDLEDK